MSRSGRSYTNTPSVVVVVNAAGLQERRAAEFARRAAAVDIVDVLVAPTRSAVVRASRGADAVYVIDPGRAGGQASAVSRALGRHCIVEVGDPQAVLYRGQGRSVASVQVGRIVDRSVGLLASAVVVRGRALVAELDIRRRWMLLPDGVDLDLFSRATGDLRDQLGLARDDLVIGVVGSITWAGSRSWCYGMELVEALACLRDLPVKALVVGDGTGLERLRVRATALGVGDRLLTPGRVPHGEVPAYLHAMDVCVSSQTNDAVGRGRTTAKLPEYLAADRYVLATRVGEAARLLPEQMLVDYDGSFDPGYPARLADRIRGLVPQQHRLRHSGATRDIAARHFDYDALAARWEAFIAATVKGDP